MFRQIVVNKPPRKVMAKYAATLHAELLKAIPWRTPVPHEELILQRFIGSLFFKSATVRIVETTNEHGRIHAHSVTSTANSKVVRMIDRPSPEQRNRSYDRYPRLPEQAHTVESKALAVKRFDRLPNGEPVHMEDFAQVFGQFPNDKYKHRSYANIAAVLWAESGEEATWEFVRRLVFSVLIGNADMHLKNWSLLYPDRRKPVLSPAYDFVATLPYIPGDTLGLSFGGSKGLDGITPDQMRSFADTARIPASPLWQIAVDTAERTAAAWKTLEHADLLPKDLRAAIEKQILTVAATTK